MQEKNTGTDVHFRREILESLLVVASRDGQDRLPTIEEFILSEVVNGTMAYIQGADVVECFTYEPLWPEFFLRRIWKYFNAQFESVGVQKLEPRIKSVVRKLVEPHTEHAPPDRPHIETELGHHFKGFAGGGICPVVMQSTFSLPAETVCRVKRDVLPSLSDAEKRDVLGIGALMQKYVADDVGFIYKNYHW